MLDLKSGSVLWTAAAAFMILSTPASGHYLQEDEPLMVHRLEVDTADRIRSHILDPILGPGRSFAFVELKLEVKRERQTQEKMGSGSALRLKEIWSESEGKVPAEHIPSGRAVSPRRSKEADPFRRLALDPEGDFDLVQASTDTGSGSTEKERSEVSRGSQRSQESTQVQAMAEHRSEASIIFKDFKVFVVHDAAVPPARLRMLRETILKAYERDLRREAIRFHGADFFSAQ